MSHTEVPPNSKKETAGQIAWAMLAIPGEGLITNGQWGEAAILASGSKMKRGGQKPGLQILADLQYKPCYILSITLRWANKKNIGQKMQPSY
jgi:hypothetical protein